LADQSAEQGLCVFNECVEAAMLPVEVDGALVLLVRDGNAVYALAAPALMPEHPLSRARATLADWFAHSIRHRFVF
jgi:hypothetical protein